MSKKTPSAALVVLVLSMLVRATASAADLGPADDGALQWALGVERASGEPTNEVELVFTAEISDGWILYASDFAAEIGPRPAKFSFTPDANVELLGPVRAVRSLRRTDKTWNTEYSYFEKRAEFRQKVRLRNGATTVDGRIDGQTCYEPSGLCALFSKSFALNVPKSPSTNSREDAQ
jgi:hypothetical protein